MVHEQGKYHVLCDPYLVVRIDGKPLDSLGEFFFIDCSRDPHARKAMLAYADSIEPDNPEKAKDVRKRVHLSEERAASREVMVPQAAAH